MNSQTVALVLEILFALVVFVVTGGLGILILVRIGKGQIDLRKLISEPNGDASLSRFQLLIFTFVIALSLFLIVVGSTPPKFPATIPPEILTLLGISASSYLVSKGIQFSSPAGVARPGLTLTPNTFDFTAPNAPASKQFTASVARVDAGTPLPAITWALDSPSHGSITPEGIYTPPAPGDPSVKPGATVKIRAQAAGYEDGEATVTLSKAS